MLAELAVATAAFKTVKDFLTEGKELYEMGDQLMGYFDAKTKLQREVNNSTKSDKSDLEEFMALEAIKQQEDELRELMIYTGRAGMWQDWLDFQRKAAQRRKEQEQAIAKAKIERQEKMYQYFEIGVAVALISAMGIFLIWLFYALSTT
jgi:hypothetical protein